MGSEVSLEGILLGTGNKRKDDAHSSRRTRGYEERNWPGTHTFILHNLVGEGEWGRLLISLQLITQSALPLQSWCLLHYHCRFVLGNSFADLALVGFPFSHVTFSWELSSAVSLQMLSQLEKPHFGNGPHLPSTWGNSDRDSALEWCLISFGSFLSGRSFADQFWGMFKIQDTIFWTKKNIRTMGNMRIHYSMDSALLSIINILWKTRPFHRATSEDSHCCAQSKILTSGRKGQGNEEWVAKTKTVLTQVKVDKSKLERQEIVFLFLFFEKFHFVHQ